LPGRILAVGSLSLEEKVRLRKNAFGCGVKDVDAILSRRSHPHPNPLSAREREYRDSFLGGGASLAVPKNF
jgi:hypothetical protein